MVKKIKYAIILIIAVIILFSNKVLAASNYNIMDKNGIKVLYYGNEELRLNPQGDGSKSLLELLAGDQDNSTSIKNRKEFVVDTKVENLLGAAMYTGVDNYLDFRRCVCVSHKYSGNGYLKGGYYFIDFVLDSGVDSKGNKIFTYFAKDSKGSITQKTLSHMAKDLSTVVSINNKYRTDFEYTYIPLSQYKPEVTYIWRQFLLGNKENGNQIISGNYDPGADGAESIENAFTSESNYALGEKAYTEYNSKLNDTTTFQEITIVDVKNKNNKTIDAKENPFNTNEIGLNGENYTMIGPFCLNFNKNNGIANIKVNNNTSIYWIYEQNDSKNYNDSNNWKGKDTIGEIESKKVFYLAVKSSSLPAKGSKYKVEFTQKESTEADNKIRILGLRSAYEQQLLTIVEAPTEHKGSVSYEIERKGGTDRKLTIVKVDANEFGTRISGVKLKVYADLGNNNKGWVSGKDADNKTYKDNFQDATVYETDKDGRIDLENLEVGQYYIYEVEAAGPDYILEDQKNEDLDDKYGFEDKWDIVYLGKIDATQSASKEWVATFKQVKPQPITIEKVDSNNKSIKLQGVTLKIYAKLENGNEGWLTDKYDLTQDFKKANSWVTNSSGQIELEKTKKGKYHIFETKTAAGYNLQDQKAHYTSDYNNFAANNNCVYLGAIENENDNNWTTKNFQFNQYSPAELTVRKVDHDNPNTMIDGVQFVIFMKDKGWLGYDSEKGKVTFENDWKDVCRFETGRSYCGIQRVSGTFTLNNLPYGDYYVIEVKPKDGYYLQNQKEYYPGSNYDFLNKDEWKMKDDSGKGIPSVLCGQKAYEKGFTSVLKSNGQPYAFYRYKDFNNPNNDEKVDYIHLDSYSGMIQGKNGNRTYYYGTNHAIYTVKNRDSAELKIVKKDATTGKTLKGAEFIISVIMQDGNNSVNKYVTTYLNGNGKITANYVERKDETLLGIEDKAKDENIVLKTDDNGEINIAGLKDGQYEIYETKAPTGYKLEGQDGYNKLEDGFEYVRCGVIIVSAGKVTHNGNLVLTENNGTYELEIKNNPPTNPPPTTPTPSNISLNGYVWIDNANGKANTRDNIYTVNSNDYYYKDGIKVNLYKYDKNYKNPTKIANTTTYTQSDVSKDPNKELGHYEFKDVITEEDLPYCYVEFEYDNKKYICVDTFVGSDARYNSKAKEYKMEVNELEDEKLTGTTGNLPGRAITSPAEDGTDSHKLTYYFNKNNLTVENINLGLIEKKEPKYSVEEEIAYVKVKINGYEFKYKYSKDTAIDLTDEILKSYVPTANLQIEGSDLYTGTIYPTELAYNELNGKDKLNVYVVYNITVKNDEPQGTDYDLYVEDRLYLESLANTYDKVRYTLCTKENTNDSDQFDLWEGSNGTVYYRVNEPKSVYADGITYDAPKTTQIQFKLTKDALTNMLGKNLFNIENTPTEAKANAFHEYWRTDNVWIDGSTLYSTPKKSAYYYYGQHTGAQIPYYLHKSKSEDRDSESVYFNITMGEAREVSGTVFKDDNVKTNGEVLGNGKKDDKESSIQGVTVDLLEVDEQGRIKTTTNGNPIIATLYQVNNLKGETKPATTTTDAEGKYKFEGVMPGRYILRFTYGDGTQKYIIKEKNQQGKLVDKEVNIISSDYKSTIITDDTVKNANEGNNDGKWFRNIGDNYSTAVDDLMERQGYDFYEYNVENGKEYANQVEYNDEARKKAVHAYTPWFGSSIENVDGDSITVTKKFTEDTVKNRITNGEGLDKILEDFKDFFHKYNYEKFNFGIIESPNETITVEKTISSLELQDQTGLMLLNGDPVQGVTSSSGAMSALASNSKGCTYADVTLEDSVISDAKLIVNYKVVVTNNSDLDYIEENNQYLGYYYKYGERPTAAKAKVKDIKVDEVKDLIDTRYSLNGQYNNVEYMMKNNKNVTITRTVNSEKVTTNCLKLKDLGSIERKKSKSVEYSVYAEKIGSNTADLLYENDAIVTKIALEKLTTLTSKSTWHEEARTSLTIHPPTGEDRSPLIYIVTGTLLIILAGGIMLIKKFVL